MEYRIMMIGFKFEVRELMSKGLGIHYKLEWAERPEETALFNPDLVLLYSASPKYALFSIDSIKNYDAEIPVIILGSKEEVSANNTADLRGHGAYQFLLPPYDLELLKKYIDSAIQARSTCRGTEQ